MQVHTNLRMPDKIVNYLDYFAGCRIDFGFLFFQHAQNSKDLFSCKLEFQNRIVIVMNCLHWLVLTAFSVD